MIGKLNNLDNFFSRYIRLRDLRCLECKVPGYDNSDGERILGLECSHYHIRSKMSVRFYPDNTDTFCHFCHGYYEENPEEYKKFKIRQLGLERFKELELRASTMMRLDPVKVRLEIRKLINNLE